MPQQGPAPRLRMKRPLQPPPQHQMQQQQRLVDPATKQRRMDLLLPDRNEDADCHVIAQQKRNDGLPVIQNVQGSTAQQSNRNDSTIHLTDSITLSVRQPGELLSYFALPWLFSSIDARVTIFYFRFSLASSSTPAYWSMSRGENVAVRAEKGGAKKTSVCFTNLKVPIQLKYRARLGPLRKSRMPRQWPLYSQLAASPSRQLRIRTRRAIRRNKRPNSSNRSRDNPPCLHPSTFKRSISTQPYR